MEILGVIGGIAVAALLYAGYASSKINSFKVDHDRINELSGIIQSGAMAFLYREYKALVPFVIIVAALLAGKSMFQVPYVSYRELFAAHSPDTSG